MEEIRIEALRDAQLMTSLPNAAIEIAPRPCSLCSRSIGRQTLYGALAVARGLSVGTIPDFAVGYMTTGYHLPDSQLDQQFAQPHVDNK